jgi:SET domain-containing protein
MPSKIAGVGVFALRNIPKGVDPFKEKDTKYIPIKEQELENIDANVRDYIRKLFIFSDGCYWLPEQGIQTLCITHFLNHSNDPNLTTSENADIFFAIRDIQAGEELTVDYDLFDNLVENFRKN